MCSSYRSGYDRKRGEIFLIMAKCGVRVPQNFFCFTFFLVTRSKNRENGQVHLKDIIFLFIACHNPVKQQSGEIDISSKKIPHVT